MNGINLLPWREEKRQARDKQMIVSAVFIWVLSAALVFGGYSYLQVLKKNQNTRNAYLNTEIKKLDEKIKEVNRLQKRKDDLLSRMEVIQNLQRQRTQIVRIFDDVVRKLPDGVYFDTLAKKSRRFNFTGTAQSNARVSNLMESLGSSDWFHDPQLDVINVTPSQGVRISQFNLGVSQRKKKKAAPNPTKAKQVAEVQG
jgi:type IV pilus assembly protein PilN